MALLYRKETISVKCVRRNHQHSQRLHEGKRTAGTRICEMIEGIEDNCVASHSRHLNLETQNQGTQAE